MSTYDRKNVLVIAGDHDLRVGIRSALENAGHFVTSATNGADALTMLEKITKPSTIILGTWSPILSVGQFLELLRASENFSDIHLITFSNPIDLEEILAEVDRGSEIKNF